MARFFAIALALFVFAFSAFADTPESITPDEIARRSSEALRQSTSFAFTGTAEAAFAIEETTPIPWEPGSSESVPPLTISASGKFSGRMAKQDGREVPDVALDASFVLDMPMANMNSVPMDAHFRYVNGVCFQQFGPSGMPVPWETSDCVNFGAALEEQAANVEGKDGCKVPADVLIYGRITPEMEDPTRFLLSYVLDKEKFVQALAAYNQCRTAQAKPEMPYAIESERLQWSFAGEQEVDSSTFLVNRTTMRFTVEKTTLGPGNSVSGNMRVDVAFRDYGAPMEITAPEITPPAPDDFIQYLCSQIPAGEERPEECSQVH